MSDFLLFVLGYITGIGFSLIMFRPMKNWSEGYGTAKEFYGNWRKGFDDGYKAGWERALVQIELDKLNKESENKE